MTDASIDPPSRRSGTRA